MAGFAVAVNNGSAEPRYYVDHLHRQHVQLQQQQQPQSQRQQQQLPRYPVQMLSGHVPTLAAKEAVLEPPLRRDDLVYVHCATTEDEEVAEDEEEESMGLTRSRSWLCCPSDRRPDKTVPIQVEANKDMQNAVSFPGSALRRCRRRRGRKASGKGRNSYLEINLCALQLS